MLVRYSQAASLGLSLQAYKAEHTKDQPDQCHNQINDPHVVLLLLKRTGTIGLSVGRNHIAFHSFRPPDCPMYAALSEKSYC